MSRKSLAANLIFESSPATSSPLRRSINVQEITPQVLVENDDEAERLALRCDNVTNNTSSNNTSRRFSLGLSNIRQIPEPKMKEHISLCIKLNNENKINVKNAFGLEMINFMTFMFTKRKSEVTDLQGASVTLDVSSRIYSYRIDNLHTDVLVLSGGSNKQQTNVESTTDEPEAYENEGENEEQKLKNQMKKKKKKAKKNIFSTEAALKGHIETSYPMPSVLGSGDLCTSDMLYQVALPNHANSGFYLHPYNDIILDVLDETRARDKNSLEYTISAIKGCSNLDICTSFSDFQFLNWSQADKAEDLQTSLENNASRYRFDLDASIPSDEGPQPVNYFDIQDDNDENINQCMRNREQVENIVDLRDIVTAQIPLHDKPSEYSFIETNFIHWAGPSYWKIKSFGKVLSNSKVVETCHQMPVKKKTNTILQYNNDLNSFKKNFSPVQALKIQYKNVPKTWNFEKTTLPEDVHYDILQLNKLYRYPLIINKDKNQLNATQLPDNENYDYANEHDTSNYCPNISTHELEFQDGNDFEELQNEDMGVVGTQMPFTGDNLVAIPKLTQKNFLQYSQRSKKIDMRQLKKTIWRSLTLRTNVEKDEAEKEIPDKIIEKMEESKPFSTVYKSLPNALSKTNAEALSFPIAFVSLLHLANEKSLKLSSPSDLSDIIVEKD
ncbi:hypothetical protein KPH14_001344 [Odynerus spinipes]|uniref:Condensin complex subunit 2 n=1 Tax=Odynerus spinipes TaxID=1348599 RepID=A0AAD9REA1_9HYME|nr:hypothetical protein KPH14_001344 [Odynerus spinipes]